MAFLTLDHVKKSIICEVIHGEGPGQYEVMCVNLAFGDVDTQMRGIQMKLDCSNPRDSKREVRFVVKGENKVIKQGHELIVECPHSESK